MGAEIVVWMRCPGCRFQFVGAVILSGAWWAAGSTPEKAAGRTYCPKCDHVPPMDLSEDLPFEAQG